MHTAQALRISTAAVCCLQLICFPAGNRFSAVRAAEPQMATSHTAAESRSPRRSSSDVVLDDSLQLRGRLVTRSEEPVAATTVSLLAKGDPPRTVTTDAEGKFVFTLQRGGTYVIAANRSVHVCRAWQANTAPPAARAEVTLVDDPAVVRGQQPIQDVLICHPILLGTIIAAAIAIPIAIHNSGSDQPSGS